MMPSKSATRIIIIAIDYHRSGDRDCISEQLLWYQAISSSMSFQAFVSKNKWKLLIATQGVVTIALMYKRKLDLEASKRGMKDSNTQQANISTGR